MAKYRKKPVVIEAWQFTKENFKKGVPHWVKHSDRKVELWSQYGGNSIGGEIETLEGIYEVSENDWIIKGIKGELYPCKPDIFEMTYEKVESGVTPREVHREARVQNLQRAIREHLAYGLQIPLEWVKEYNCLLKESEENNYGK